MKIVQILIAGFLFTSCSTQKLQPYDAPVMDEAQLAAAAKTACEAAQKNDGRVLLEFSAAWCGDCQRLNELKQQSPLREELGTWQSLVVNIGKFEHHQALLEHYEVQAIADWRVLAPPNDCTRPITSWKTIGLRTLEPASGHAVGSKELAKWLQILRTQ